jgi:hypothetical protein
MRYSFNIKILKKGIGMTDTPSVTLWRKSPPTAILWQIKAMMASGFVGSYGTKNERL